VGPDAPGRVVWTRVMNKDMEVGMQMVPSLNKTAILAAMTLVIAACGAGEEPASDSGAASSTPSMSAAAPTLAAVQETGLRNAALPASNLATGGQPSPEQVEALMDVGFERFISLRPAGEDGAGWEEDALPGASFARLPISGAGDLTRENVERFAELMEEHGAANSVVYCASGNRVGALMALKAAWIDGVAPSDALALGTAAGMTRLQPAVEALLAGSND